MYGICLRFCMIFIIFNYLLYNTSLIIELYLCNIYIYIYLVNGYLFFFAHFISICIPYVYKYIYIYTTCIQY